MRNIGSEQQSGRTVRMNSPKRHRDQETDAGADPAVLAALTKQSAVEVWRLRVKRTAGSGNLPK
jgi:hypothetical protein